MNRPLDIRMLMTTMIRGFSYLTLTGIISLLLLWNSIIFGGAIENLNGGGGNDFSRFYHATQSFFNGQGLYAPSLATHAQWYGMYGQHMWDLNPPHFHLIFFPLTLLSIENAFLLWTITSLGAFLLSLYLISREIAPNITILKGAIILTGILIFTGTGLLLRSAQISFLLLLPFTLAWIEARHNNWTKAGIYLGISACIKPFFLIFLPYLIIRRYFAALRSYLIIFIGAFILGSLIFGGEEHRDWLVALSSVNWFWAGSNASILGFLSRSLGESPSFSVTTSAPALIGPLWIIASAFIGLITIFISAADHTSKAVDRSFSILLIAAFLISPLGWTYYYFFLFAPLSSLLMDWWDKSIGMNQYENNWNFHVRKAFLFAAIPGLMVPMYFVTWYQPNPLATVSIGSIYFWSTLCMWFSLMCDWHLIAKKRASSIPSRISVTDTTSASPLIETIH